MVNDILFYRQNLLKIAESRHLMSNTHQCIFIIARRRIFGKHPRLLFRTVLNRIKRAAFGAQAHVVMREPCTFRFDAAKPLSNNRLEKEILYIIMCTLRSRSHAPSQMPPPAASPKRQSKAEEYGDMIHISRQFGKYVSCPRIPPPHPKRPPNAAAGGIKEQTQRKRLRCLFFLSTIS